MGHTRVGTIRDPIRRRGQARPRRRERRAHSLHVSEHAPAAVRLLAAVFVAAAIGWAGVGPRQVLLACAYYLTSTAALPLLRERRAAGVAASLVDIAFLQWAMYVTGGLDGPGPYLLVLHVIAAALLGTQGSVMWVTLGHAASIVVTDRAIFEGVIAAPPPGVHGPTRLVVILASVWLVALATSWLSAVNERDLRQRRVDLERLSILSTVLAEAHDPAEVTAALLDHVDLLISDARTVIVEIRDGAPTVLDARRAHRPADRVVALHPHEMLRRCARQRETLISVGLPAEGEEWLAQVIPEPRSLMLVPLGAREGTLAVLVVEQPGPVRAALESRLVSVLEQAADHASLALTTTRLQNTLTRSAMTDGLTGVANRRAFDEALDRELARADRAANEVSLLLLDLDHFKVLNDRFGHAVGDEVLARVARELSVTLRPSDTFARYGGEEFAVILPETSRREAGEIAERLRLAMGAVIAPDGRQVTISIGSATVDPIQGLDANLLIRTADRALYRAKEAGRDRVATA